MKNLAKTALAGNRTQASRVAGENSTTEPPVPANTLFIIALMSDNIRQAKITTKPRFENGNFKVCHKLIIPKTSKMKKRAPGLS